MDHRSDGQRKTGSIVRPSLDHYTGRPVDSVIQYGDEDWQWAVRLEGGTLIKNHDKRRTVAPSDVILGTVVGNSIYSELDTRIVFSNGEEVVFTPTKYSLSDPGFTGDREVFPQDVAAEEAVVIPDPSDRRVVNGPSAEFLALQAKEAEERLESMSLEGTEEAEITEMGGGGSEPTG